MGPLVASPGGREAARGLGFHSSTPALIQVYSAKPLPPLPLSGSSPRATRKPASSSREPVAGPRTTMADAEPRFVATFSSTPSPASWTHPRRSRYSSPSASGRRSSHKVQQLTGYDVDIMDDPPRSARHRDAAICPDDCPRCEAIDTSDDDEYIFGLVPSRPLGDHAAHDHPPASRWADVDSLGLNKLSLEDSPSGSPRSTAELEPPSAGLSPEALQRWAPGFRQFSDSKVAGEYHRIAVELATRYSRHAGADPQTPGPASRRKRSSLHLNLGVGRRLTRRRHAGSAASHPPSAFDDDSEGEGARSSSRIRGWLGRRTEENASWDRAGDHVRGLLHSAKDRARMLQMSRAERRRQELRRHIRVVPLAVDGHGRIAL